MAAWEYPATEAITGSTKIKEADNKLTNAMSDLQDWINSEGDWTGTGATLNYTTIDAMTDTDLTSPTEGQFLMLDGSDKWANATIVATDVGAITNGSIEETARINITSDDSQYTARFENTDDANAVHAVGHAYVQGHTYINQYKTTDLTPALKIVQAAVGYAVLDLNTETADQYNSIKFNHDSVYKWALQSGLDGVDFALYNAGIDDNVWYVNASGSTTIQSSETGTRALFAHNIGTSDYCYGLRAEATDSANGSGLIASGTEFGVIGEGLSYDVYCPDIASSSGEIYAETGYSPFTGSHLTYSAEVFAIGDIVSTDNVVEITNINNTVFTSTISNTNNAKAVIGVVSKNKGIVTEDTTGLIPEDLYAYTQYAINSLGEGAINVCDANGDIENGDYITSSTVAGKGQKQSDDVVHNYTVAKSLQDVIWANETIGVDGCFEADGAKCKLIGCVYTAG